LPLGVQGFRFQGFIGVTSSVVIAGLDPAIHADHWPGKPWLRIPVNRSALSSENQHGPPGQARRCRGVVFSVAPEVSNAKLNHPAGLDPAIHLCFAWRGIVGAVRDRAGQTMMCREPQ
jgi:hypothetical protein